MGDMRELGEALKAEAKRSHQERMKKTPDRIRYAISLFEKNDIEYKLFNESIGHFHCRRKRYKKLFQFWAGTGKIMGYENARGIHKLIRMLQS